MRSRVLMWQKMTTKEGRDLFNKWVAKVFDEHKEKIGTSQKLYTEESCGKVDELNKDSKSVEPHSVLYTKP